MKFELKALSPEAVPRALAKAERYRLLNEPREAESICLDALEREPDNQEALRTLLLALTDQFGKEESPLTFAEARKLVARLRDEYDRAYYTGIILERQAKAHLQDASGTFERLREAMSWYEKAEAIRPLNNDDAVLRWNTCARMIMRDLA
jgi:tetratricopeptide (TPR) repeat protein